MELNKDLFNDKYFKLVSKCNGTLKIKCLMCHQTKDPLSAKEGVNSNILRHFRSVHKAQFQIYQATKSDTPQKRKMESSENPPGKVQKTMEYFEKKCSQDEATKLISAMVVTCSLPLTIVEKHAFKEMISRISEGKCHSINRRTLGKSINAQYDEFVLRLKEEVKKVSFCSTTCDIWSNKKRSFMGMTLHTICEKTLKRQSFPLACSRFRGRHTFDKVAEVIVNIHEQYDLSLEKVTKVLTDNGSNMVKCFQQYGVKSMTVLDDQSEEIFEAEQDSDIEDEDDIDFIPVPEPDPNDNHEIIYELPSREKCFAHTLSLIATSDLKKITTFPAEYKRVAGPSGTAMSKLSALWNMTSRPRTSEIIVNGFGRSIERPCLTRWNSLYDCLNSLLSFSKDQINGVMSSLDLPKLKDTEFEYLYEYKRCLAPIATAIDVCQGEKNAFYGMAIPVLQKVRKEMLQMQNQDFKCCGALVTCILESLNRRFEHFYAQDNCVIDALLATASHPRFKLKDIMESKKEHVRDQFIRVAEEMLELSEQPKQHDEAFVQDLSNDYFADSDEDENQNGTQSTKDMVSLEILKFLNDPDKSIDMLHRYPVVKKVFLKYNTALISSAPVERLFSFGSIILNGRRGSLKDDNFEKLILLKAMSSMNK